MSVPEIVWEDPPPAPNNTKFKYVPFADALRKEPRRWAKFPRTYAKDNTARVTVTAINTGRMYGFAPARSFEAVARKGDVFVRYVGES